MTGKEGDLMDISTVITQSDFADLTQRVNTFNRSLGRDRAVKNILDKDDFLKLLLTQLTHQDPTRPLEDTEFVAQMAQFSTLEQISNMNTELEKVFNLLTKSQAIALLGKTVEIREGSAEIIGVVTEVTGSEYPQLLVNDRYYDVSDVERILK